MSIKVNMKVGDTFSSYEEFHSALAEYKKRVYNEFWIRDARTIETQYKRSPETVENINKSLKYYYMRLACIKGGRPYKSKNEDSKRKCTTYKQDCEASIFVRVSTCKQYLSVQEVNENHNHEYSEDYFTSLTQQRLKVPESIKKQATDYLVAGANKNIRKKTGCKVTLKDLTNMTRRKTEKKTFEGRVEIIINTYECKDVEALTDSGPKYLTDNTKFKLIDERGKKMAQLCSEVSTNILRKRLETIETIIKCWEEGHDEILLQFLKSNFSENTDQEQEISRTENPDRFDKKRIGVKQDENKVINEQVTHKELDETISEIKCDLEEYIKDHDQSNNEEIEEYLDNIITEHDCNSILYCDNDERGIGPMQVKQEAIIECIDLQTSDIVQRSSSHHIKMPKTARKRGRPKGSGNTTVIGLRRKRSCKS